MDSRSFKEKLNTRKLALKLLSEHFLSVQFEFLGAQAMLVCSLPVTYLTLFPYMAALFMTSLTLLGAKMAAHTEGGGGQGAVGWEVVLSRLQTSFSNKQDETFELK